LGEGRQEEAKRIWLAFRDLSRLAGFLGIWWWESGIGATLFMQTHDFPPGHLNSFDGKFSWGCYPETDQRGEFMRKHVWVLSGVFLLATARWHIGIAG